MLSADVNAGVDPNYEGVHDKRNASFMGKGIVLQKYTGARGKSGASDANAEYVGFLRKLFNDNGIIWQTGEIGKVDQGGGGTIAQFMANQGIEVIDCGVPVLSMHAPFEITSKIDIYIMKKAYNIFYKEVR
jgi:aspartyl aminopeptidase